jgi:serine/threonine protein kinase
VYSLAVIVYEIVTNQVVFEGNTPMEVALSHITETPTPPRAHNPDIPASAQNEIMKALQKDAGKRHSSATEFIRSLKMAYDIHDSTASRPEGLSFDTGTIPMRPDEAKTGDDSTAQEIFSSWDASSGTGESQTLVDSPADSTESGGLDTRVMGGVAIAVVLLAALGFLLVSSGGDDDSSSASGGTPQAGGEVAAPTPEEAFLEIRYNNNFFALLNPLDETTLDISGLEIRGASADDMGENFGSSLAPDGCVLIARSTTNSAPDDWNCGTPRQTINRNTNIFWWADNADDTRFTVRQNGNVIERCDTVGRAVGRVNELECLIPWERFIQG